MDIRTRATLQMVRYLDGTLAKIPRTAVEVYKELVDQFIYFKFYNSLLIFSKRTDLSQELNQKLDRTHRTVVVEFHNSGNFTWKTLRRLWNYCEKKYVT